MALPAQPRGWRRSLVGATVETTSGTGATVSAALTGTLIYDATLVPEGLLSGGERQPDGHYGGESAAIPTTRVGRMKFTQELRNGDAFSTLAQACGMGTTSPHKPKPDIANHKTITLVLWQDGVRFSIVGAMGTFKMTAKAGEKVMVEWDFMGVWQAPIAEAMPAFAPITSLAHYLNAATVYTIGGATVPLISQFEVDMGWPVAMRPDIKSVGGNLHAAIDPGARKTVINIDPEGHLIADYDPYATLLAGTTAALVFTVSDGTNTFSVTAPALQFREIDMSKRDRAATTPITAVPTQSTGSGNTDDDIVMTIA